MYQGEYTRATDTRSAASCVMSSSSVTSSLCVMRSTKRHTKNRAVSQKESRLYKRLFAPHVQVSVIVQISLFRRDEFLSERKFFQNIPQRKQNRAISRKDTRKIEVFLDKTCAYKRYLDVRSICTQRRSACGEPRVSQQAVALSCAPTQKRDFCTYGTETNIIDAENRAVSRKETCLHE